jgi:hypothetical protein
MGNRRSTVDMAAQKQGMQLLLDHRYKFITAAALIVVALFIPLETVLSASTSLNAALQISRTTARSATRVQTYQSSAASHRHSPSAVNSSDRLDPREHNYTNSSSQPSSSPSVSPSPSPTSPPTAQCIHVATAAEPKEQEITALLGHHVRPLPPTDSSSPVLATSNWEGLANKEHTGDQCEHF